MLLSTAYFPPIQFFTKIVDQKSFYLESNESYQKQSYRNRFFVYGANGPIRLNIPVVKGRSLGKPIKEVKMDYSEAWNKTHMKTIKSAYSHSPYYEFYIDDFMPFWEKKWVYLYDLNLEIIHVVLDALDLNIKVLETETYTPKDDNNSQDFRKLIHPKVDWKDDPGFIPEHYTQNFSDKHGFQANLSIIDLIFQTGSEAESILRKSATKKG